MINLMVANVTPDSQLDIQTVQTYLRAQIDVAYEFGWSTDKIAIISNFEFSYRSVNAIRAELNRNCLTGSKIFAAAQFLEVLDQDILWCHDLDAWQNHQFDPPVFSHVGICQYSTPKYNGGSVFYRRDAIDIVKVIRDELLYRNASREEPVINEVLRRPAYSQRITCLNSTYNVGCSGFLRRLERSHRPVRCLHFHPLNRIAWNTHARNGHKLAEGSPLSTTLRLILLSHFGERISQFRYSDGFDATDILHGASMNV